jgi:polar amino acid transport system permease protein
MSERTTAETGRAWARGVAAGGNRVADGLWIAAGVVFWGWIGLRWLADWVLPAGIGPAPGEPVVDPAAVEALGVVIEVDLLVVVLEFDFVGPMNSLAFAVEFLPRLAGAAWLTIVITVVSMALGLLIAVPLSVARVYGDRSRWASLAYVELIRGTPLLAQLFVLYYALNFSQYFRGVPESPWLPGAAVYVAVVGFTINSAAYQSEYIRSALLSVDERQLTAARSVGLSKLEGIRHVVLPQGLRFAIPGWSNELVYLIKYSSLAAFITVPELFQVARSIAADNFDYLGVFSLVAVMYLGLVITAAKLMTRLEDRLSIPGLGSADPER